MESAPLISIVMPCLNEERTVACCVNEAVAALRGMPYGFEVVVADNGSTDNTRAVAEAAGARVVSIQEPGYGAALMGGFRAAKGKYVLMGDADMSYDFSDAPKFVAKIEEGFDMVVGNRFLGGISKGAMPFLHKYLGNPVLSFIGRLFFKAPVGDFHCGMRIFDREKLLSLRLDGSGMEFASEMISRAALSGWRMTEVPTVLRPDGRDRRPHLRTWRDGWRHLKLLLLYCPLWLFSIPGAAMLLIGVVLMVLLMGGPLHVGAVILDVHTLVYAAMLQIAGFQILSLGLFARGYATSHGLISARAPLWKLPMEWGIVFGCVLLLCGVSGSVYALTMWSHENFVYLNPIESLRIVIPSALAITFGLQCVFMSFVIEVLRLKSPK